MNETVMSQERVAELFESLRSEVGKIIKGQVEAVSLCLYATLAEGHVLIEGVPGTGKTLLVRSLSNALDCDFKRIQFTPDLMPSDVVGVNIYNPKETDL